MKTPSILAVVISLSGLAGSTLAAAPSTYQVTGPVLAVTDSTITVQKETEKWEIARDADTKITGDLKVGSKVTITYTMTAKGVTVKDAPAAKPAAAPAKPAEKKPK